MKRNVLKKLIFSLYLAFIIIIISTYSFAGQELGRLDQYYDPSVVGDMSVFMKAIGLGLGFLQKIGISCGVLLIMFLGIKFLMASAEEKAEYKESFTPWVVGICLLIAGSSLPSMIYNLVLKLANT